LLAALVATFAPARAVPEKARFVRREVGAKGQVLSLADRDTLALESLWAKAPAGEFDKEAPPDGSSSLEEASPESRKALAQDSLWAKLPAQDGAAVAAGASPGAAGAADWPLAGGAAQARVFASGNGSAEAMHNVSADALTVKTAGLRDEEGGGHRGNPRGRVATCTISGDPHIHSFDSSIFGGPYWHPMFSPGHWWLVRTESKRIEMQAIYGKCGMKGHGGWMAARHKGAPRCCISGFLIGGTLLRNSHGVHHKLMVKSPCEWDWERSVCKTKSRKPRVFWVTEIRHGGKHHEEKAEVMHLTRWRRTDPNVLYHMPHPNKIDIHLPDGVRVHLYLWGHWRNGQAAHMNAQIIQRKEAAHGRQCGHCGSFNGNSHDDRIYTQTGALNLPQAKRIYRNNMKLVNFCNADVSCQERLAKAEGRCRDNSKGSTFNMKDCKGKVLEGAKKACGAAFKKVVHAKKWLEDEELKACVEDECTGHGFAKADAEEAKDEQKEVKKLNKRAR